MKAFDSELKSVNNISEYLNITKGSIIQVAGSGGKTTLISAVAEENLHFKTAILTTTKRYIPKSNGYVIKSGEIISTEKISGNIVEIGTISSKEKIGWVGNENYEIIKNWADIILIEADGSKHLPLKAASEYEPVFVDDATHTLIVCGLSSYNKKIQEVCHRYPLIQSRYPENTPVSKETISFLLKSYYYEPCFYLNPYFIINQADNEKLQKIGTEILLENNFSGLITSFL